MHVRDSRVILIKKGIAYPISINNKPTLKNEIELIETAYEWINDGMILGNINLTRAFIDC